MRLKHFAALGLAAILGAAAIAYAQTANSATARHATEMKESFFRMNGEHAFRALLTPTDVAAEDNSNTAGNSAGGLAAVQYTFIGGERICYEAHTTDAWVQVNIASASMTAAGAKARFVKADQSGDVVCDALLDGTAKVSALCTAAGPCEVKIFEVR